jgi:hypothetical protein
MAPPRKKRVAPSQTHPVHLRLAGDVFARLEAKAKNSIRPLNRVSSDELTAYPKLERDFRLSELTDHMETLLARYGARIVAIDLSDALLQSVDGVLAAETDSKLRSAVDRLRVVRREMLKHQALAKK